MTLIPIMSYIQKRGAVSRVSAAVSADGLTYTITFSTDISSSAGDPHDGITIKDGASTLTIASSVISGANLIITLDVTTAASYIGKNNGSPTDEYNSAAADSDIQGSNNMELESYSATAATNNSKMLIVDTFTASNRPIDTHTALELNDAGGAYVELSGAYNIQTNAVENNTPAGNNVVHKETDEADVVITMDGLIGTAGQSVGINARVVDDDNAWVLNLEDGNQRIAIYELTTASGFTLKASTGMTVTDSVTYSIEFTLSGTSLTGKVDGANDVTFTSSVHQAATKHAMKTATATTSTMDNLVVEAV